MQQISLLPARPLAGRGYSASRGTGDADPRWQLLDLARQCRRPLGLRDRDVTVLRGLLSLLPAHPGPAQRLVYASNHVLIARCDGIDERTLRRRLAHLIGCGLIARQSSPSGKRYRVGDPGAADLAYGIDLAPLFRRGDDLQHLAAETCAEDHRVAARRARLRDLLFRHPQAGSASLREEARLSLRRNLASAALDALIAQLLAACPEATASDLTASDGQNDRDIQRSDTESLDSETDASATEKHADAQPQDQRAGDDISLATCIDLLPTACSLAEQTPRRWPDLVTLSEKLAPGIGLSPTLVARATRQLGRQGCALAVLGLVEGLGRLRNPAGYLTTLLRRAETRPPNIVRMFRSLVAAAAPGHRQAMWSGGIPG